VSFYSFAFNFLNKGHKVKSQIAMNKKVLDGSFAETDEAMGPDRF